MAPNIMLTLLFLAGLLVVYYLAPERARWGILLAASLLFYISADSRMAALVVASAVWSWITGRKIGQAKNKREKRGWLLACILPLLGILFLFKYFDFFRASIEAFLTWAGLSVSSLVLSLALPMGISYYTFKMISYAADIYTGKRGAEPHAGYYLTYVLFSSRRFSPVPSRDPEASLGRSARVSVTIPLSLRRGCKDWFWDCSRRC